MRVHFAQTVTVSLVLVCLGILVSPARADYKNFGVYQDTNADGVLNPGDTYLGGFMSWMTYYSAATSYNYSAHSDPALIGQSDLTGAPYAANQSGDPVLSWLPMDDDELHIYVAWSYYGNTSAEGELYERAGFSLGLIANDYIRGRTDFSASGGYDLDIAVRNDATALPQVTMSDDYDTNGRPPFPGFKADSSQEFYKITDPDLLDPYNHHFEGRWHYTASTADGGIIDGIHNGDYDIDIDPLDIVTSMTGDGLVIRIDPLAFDEVSKIVIYDFGYSAGAVDTVGLTPPVGYNEFGPVGLVIPLEIMENYVGPLRPLKDQTWRANFYKCADHSSHPHWACWSPIAQRLWFHQPQFFGELRFA